MDRMPVKQKSFWKKNPLGKITAILLVFNCPIMGPPSSQLSLARHQAPHAATNHARRCRVSLCGARGAGPACAGASGHAVVAVAGWSQVPDVRLSSAVSQGVRSRCSCSRAAASPRGRRRCSAPPSLTQPREVLRADVADRALARRLDGTHLIQQDLLAVDLAVAVPEPALGAGDLQALEHALVGAALERERLLGQVASCG